MNRDPEHLLHCTDLHYWTDLHLQVLLDVPTILATPSTVLPVSPVHTHTHPPSPSRYLFTRNHEKWRIYAPGFTLSAIFHHLTPHSAFTRINPNRSFCSVACDSQSVSPSPPRAGQLCLFFKLKRDLLRILTCDKSYTLLITCQLERWNCAF